MAGPQGPTAAERESGRTVLVALAANLAIAVAKATVAAITASTAMLAEAAHSIADTGNEILLLVAQHRSRRAPTIDHPLGFGRDSYFWALLASIGVFLTGALFSAREGIRQLIAPTQASHLLAAYVVLAVAFVLESVSLARAYRQLRAEAVASGRDFIEHVILTSDPTARAVLAEDAAAVAGNAIAAVGLALHQITGSPVPDALAAVAVGILLVGVGLHLASRNRDFLIGVQAPETLRAEIGAIVSREPGVKGVADLIVSFVGPRRLWVVVRVGIDVHCVARDVERMTHNIDQSLRAHSPSIARVDVVVTELPVEEGQR